MIEPRTIGSLFSGLGLLELGLESALNAETIWQAETEVFPRRVLRKNWPQAHLYRDVRYVGRNAPHVDLICGGFPCQDISVAGRGAGLAGARSGLWSEFKRVVDELSPEWVVIENVASGAARWIDVVRGELAGLGYATLPIPLTASAVGAPHKRERIFVVAHAERERLRNVEQWRSARQSRELRNEGQAVIVEHVAKRRAAKAPAVARHHADSDDQGQLRPSGRQEGRRRTIHRAGEAWLPGTIEPDFLRVDPRRADRLDRCAALGNGVIPQCAEVVGQVIRLLCASADNVRARS